MNPAPSDFEDLRVEDVSRHFGRRRAVSHVTFHAPRGSIVGLLGPNGAGKSTILSMLATLLRPSTGRILYGQCDSVVHGAALRGSIGVLGHDLFLYPELTARENLEFFAGLYALKQPGASADAALERAGLAHRAADPVSSFSRGMRQRVALERALIHDPRLLLLDEPFTGLDESSAARLLARLDSLRKQGTIVVLATHDLDLAEGLFDRAIFLRDGRMASAADRPASLRAMYREVMTHAHAAAAQGTEG
ncbi:MAG: ABC transporter ATP-binding protein [Acidobacteria bacterium]|nr:ABC transporter ATP-binding protein [Acidobacteriota bacterium]